MVSCNDKIYKGIKCLIQTHSAFKTHNGSTIKYILSIFRIILGKRNSTDGIEIEKKIFQMNLSLNLNCYNDLKYCGTCLS